MKRIFFIPKDKYMKVKNGLLTDDAVSRQSIDFRDNVSLGLKDDGYYLIIEGSEQALKKAAEIMGTDAKELKGKEMHSIEEAIMKQEDSAMSGFGNIFG